MNPSATAVSAVPSPASNGSTAVPATSGRSGLSHHQVLASASRMAVLELLRSRAEPFGVVEVAQHVGLHQNTVRSHLDLLVDSGYVIRRSEAPKGPGRPRVVYQATAAPDGERNYRLLAEVLARHIDATSERPAEAAVNAGRSWAGSTERRPQGDDGAGGGTPASPPISEEAAVAEVVRMLGDSGFAPALSADGTSINLHRCPFRELAVIHQDVVCGTHLGILQGALAELGTTVSATRLLPFVTPGLCVATLTRSATDAGHGRAPHRSR
jgi:predicted ArsR family transcriptional regulator